MFKKLLSNLSFNPSLIQEVTFYTKRLKKEEGLRRSGLVLVVLAMGVQMFAAISPAEASSIPSGNDVLYGGFSTQAEAATKCDQNSQGIATILAYYQLNCSSVRSALSTTVNSLDYGGELDSMGRWSYGPVIPRTGKPTNEYGVKIGATTFYMRNVWAWDSGPSSTYQVLKMTNPQGITIFMMYDCGNIITVGHYTPPAIPLPQVADIEVAACDGTKKTNRFKGWAWDGDRPNSTLTVSLYIDNVKVGSYPTNILRTDLNEYLGATGTHGFDINLSNHPSSTDGKKHTTKVTFAGLLPNGQPDGKTVSSTTKEFGPCNAPVIDHCPGDGFPGTQTKDEECLPCIASVFEEDVIACLVFDKTAKNNTQNIADANGTTAAAGDSITYTLSVKNTGKVKVEDYIIEENMGDVMEYVEKVTSLGGGTMDDNKIIHWPAIDIAANATVTKTITVQVKAVIPETPQSVSNPGSFDLMMTNTFHSKTVNIKLPGSIAKIVEQTTVLPNTGPGTTVAIAVVTVIIVSYFFARSRLMAKELDIVREEFATSGGI